MFEINLFDFLLNHSSLLKERYKQKLLYGNNEKRKTDDDLTYASNNQSNFVQHKRFDDSLINPDRMIKPKVKVLNKQPKEQLPVVGDDPNQKHELLLKGMEHLKLIIRKVINFLFELDDANKKEAKRLTNNRASDDFCLERFKKNMRFSRNSKIKIA